ncbi:MAG: threonine aldolase, partial [Desulfofustis sp.]|nr:threonine aldolase [Desulfofustis sp.]
VGRRNDVHFPRIRVLSLTQATEAGTVYRPDELRELGECARRHGLKLHLDGARLANAVATLGGSPRELTVDCGVDVLCFGGTKNGMAVGDAVIFFDRQLADGFARRCKQAGQLASKMRFLAAPWISMLDDGSWLANARHANDCAARLEARLRGVPGATLLFPRQANTLFVGMADLALQRLAERGWRFYVFPEVGGARFMCSWDTDPGMVDRFADDIEAILTGQDGP